MSYTSGARFGELTDDVPDRRTVAEIQRKVIKQSGNNPVSRLFHAKNDKEMITSWKLDLNRIIHVFNVRSVGSAPFSLNISLPDRAGDQYSCDGFRSPSKCVDWPGKC